MSTFVDWEGNSARLSFIWNLVLSLHRAPLISLWSSLMGFPVTLSEEPVIVSAYADDVQYVLLFATTMILLCCSSVYMSTVKYVQHKLIGLNVKQFGSAVHHLLDFQFHLWIWHGEKEGVKYLGVYLALSDRCHLFLSDDTWLCQKELGWFASQN